jgi:hypothetical protein
MWLSKHKYGVLMSNYVRIIEYERVVLTYLHAGLFLRNLFAALTFLYIIVPLYEY